MGKSSKRNFFPFNVNPALGRKLARQHRIKQKGFGLPSSKAELRAIADQIAK